MRKGLLAALTVLVVGPGLAFPQQKPGPVSPGPLPSPAADPSGRGDVILPPGDLPDLVPVDGDLDAQAETLGLWGSSESLLWWLKNGGIPPLVTVGGNGVLGSPGTRILVDNLDFDDAVRQGGRFALGYHWETNRNLGVEANYFFLSDRQRDVRFSSNGVPILAQPFFNITKGILDASKVASPGDATGTVAIAARTSLWGAEANLTAGPISSHEFRLAALGGFRFLSLEDEVQSAEHLHVPPGPPAFLRSIVDIRDEFRTANRFYGGQLGLETGVRLGRLTVDLRGKVALGQMHQVAGVNGAMVVQKSNGSTTVFEGGLYALRTNIGRHQRDQVAFIPEVDVNVGLQLTPYWKLSAGYSLLWISTVARAGEQIDPVVNTTQFPLRSGNGPLNGPARPAFHFVGTDFWAQGLNFGLELRY